MPELPNNQLNSYPSKVMLKIILNRLKPQAEKIIAEEQAGFSAGRSTTEQIFNLRRTARKKTIVPLEKVLVTAHQRRTAPKVSSLTV